MLRPGDVLVATDGIGRGHKWRLIDDQPWRRAYVILKPGVKDSFMPKSASAVDRIGAPVGRIQGKAVG